ncbi:hypothetical protein Slu03_14840 [Sediminihabitans luteus]|nr:aminoglycoside phosphotransferase family protein [Sediminihabitans luteus]GII99106.1 hypothetical protein Slu03_14840 [Sediminihabitans luteus]
MQAESDDAPAGGVSPPTPRPELTTLGSRTRESLRGDAPGDETLSTGPLSPLSLYPLTPAQRQLVARWAPGADVVADHSWGLMGTTVLELVRPDGEHLVVKAGDAADTHIAREIRAHESWLGPWASLGRAPALVAADRDAKLLLTRYLPGTLVLGHPCEHDPDTYRQAGELLASLHAQLTVSDDGQFARREQADALAWLARPHRIDADDARVLEDAIRRWPTPAQSVVPTHGDWHPRNWLVHAGQIRAIDLGRADLRPAATDLIRLAFLRFGDAPELERAFLDGYGRDPREPGAWQRTRVREAVSAAAWGYAHATPELEDAGLRQVATLVRELGG